MAEIPTIMAGLKPCPFCGWLPPRVNKASASKMGYFVYCEECHIGTTKYGSEETALAAWNRRVPNV